MAGSRQRTDPDPDLDPAEPVPSDPIGDVAAGVDGESRGNGAAL
ncbi:hypothetical protein IFM12276_48190 [Nocardia sputorum]|uniref:Uncharacterized protein n=1 Tax=Nocardia sputorum TaxID=2984338 RepID=A0ABN6UA01_9NOCA|nr:hypothetical protein IFM12276_48190 [Nocardia sputorum]